MMMASAAWADDPKEPKPLKALHAWNAPPIPDAGTPDDAQAVDFAREGAPPQWLDGRVRDLTVRARWGELADLLARVSDGSTPGAGLVRDRGPGQLLTGAREDVRRRLRELPPAALAAYRALVDDRAALLLRDGRRRDAAIGDLLERFGATPAATIAAQALAERLLERGDLHGALLLWRWAREDARVRPRHLEARLLAARSFLGVDRPGSLTPMHPDPAAAWAVAWARRAPGGEPTKDEPARPRPVAADGVRVYLTDHRGVLALARDDGRLVWRVPLRGNPREQRVALGGGRLLIARRDRVVAVDCERGVETWQRSLAATSVELVVRGRRAVTEDRVLDVAATCAGFVALVTRESQRFLVGLSPEGTLLFETRLWPERAAEVTRPRRTVVFMRGAGEVDRNGNRLESAEPDLRGEWDPDCPSRRVMDDGRLAAIADRVVVNVDGVVLCASVAQGGVLWVRERSHGALLAGGRIWVQVAVGPYAVEAVTAAGHLVRFDPLDGSSLPLPSQPEGLYGPESTGRNEPRPYVLHLSPLVLGWQPEGKGGFYVTSSVASRPVLRLAQGPLFPGAVLGSTLALPDPEGLVLIDLVKGTELRDPLPWTLAPSPVVAAGGLLLTAGADGVVALSPDAVPTKLPDLDPEGPITAWIELLSHPDWRVRMQAQQRVEAGLLDLDVLERTAREAPTLDARDVAKDLFEQARRRRLFTKLAPQAPPWLVKELVQGVDLAEGLRLLLERVKASDRAPDELLGHVLEAEDRAVRSALLDLLLKTDERARMKLADALRDRGQTDAVRAGCAAALVAVLQRGGPYQQLQRALRGTDQEVADAWGWVNLAVTRGEDPELVRHLLSRELGRTFAQPPVVREVAAEVAAQALHEALPRLLAP